MVPIRAAKTNTTKLVVARKLVAVAVAVARADATSLSSITVTRQLGGVRRAACSRLRHAPLCAVCFKTRFALDALHSSVPSGSTRKQGREG